MGMDAIKFWNAVEKTDTCWVWRGAKSRGYGILRWDGQIQVAHRVAWKIMHGPIPNGFLVMHRYCVNDNRLCVRPSHLFLGTAAMNGADKALKGRSTYGERHWKHKMKEAQIAGFDRLRAKGWYYRELAAHFGICQKQAERIGRRESWRYLAVAR